MIVCAVVVNQLVIRGLLVPLSKGGSNLESILDLTPIPGRIRLLIDFEMVFGVAKNCFIVNF